MQVTAQNNPEATFNSTMMKSYLRAREEKRDSGSKFFQENKIRSCSYVKQTSDGFKAVPYYQKRDVTLYPTPSTVGRSWSSTVHNNRGLIHAGMGVTKPLIAFHPNQERNLIKIPDFRPPYPNSSQIEIGRRQQRDQKHYVTTHANSFFVIKRQLPTLHPGIKATRNQWLQSRINK